MEILEQVKKYGYVRETAAPNLDLVAEINRLRKEKNAVILAHYYVDGAIQDLADYIGDSLGLSQQAASTPADMIVFCGVHFMGETAKILSPEKKVVIPDLNAGCSLADSAPADKFAAFKAQYPEHLVLSYINCSAEVKALSDVICTSGNAAKIVRHAPKDRDLLFVPDENLGSWVIEQTGRPMTLWKGNCYVHVEWTHSVITRIRREHPDAPLIAHPECTRAVRLLADEVCSTEKMVTWCRNHPSPAIIVATEAGLPTSAKRDSTGICFIGERNFDPFIARYIAPNPGPMRTPEGELLGEHRGLQFYTLGQRGGLNIGGRRGGSGEPWFVAAKSVADNTLIVVQGEHPALYGQRLRSEAINWIAGTAPAAAFDCSAKIRYRQQDQACHVRLRSDGGVDVEFAERQRAITPGQSIVFYTGEVCLGGGVIAASDALLGGL